MKIGIITFHAAFNYGSMLQAYALQTFLEKQGHQVEIINFRPSIQKKIYSKPLKWSDKGNIILSIKRILFTPIETCLLYRKWACFNLFLHKYLHLTKEYNTLEELKNGKVDVDLLITGSDQIWNTSAFDFSEAYFGTFVNDSVPKIAYAPSMGPNPEELDSEYLRKLLQGYSSVSVREKRCSQFLVSNKILKSVPVVLDPTMLLEEKDYKQLYAPSPLIKEDYIFYYTPGGARHEFLKIADKIGKEYNLPVIVENAYTPGDLKRYEYIHAYPAVGPSEFLNLVKNAKIVCGASFHLMVFAILFKKKFFCINGDVDSRLSNLMTLTGNQNKIISLNSRSRKSFVSAGAASQLHEQIIESEKFLLDSIEQVNFGGTCHEANI